MAEQTFKADDYVELKHGGEEVKMTIQSISKDMHGRLKAFCSFWDKNKQKFKHDTFTLESLKFCNNS